MFGISADAVFGSVVADAVFGPASIMALMLSPFWLSAHPTGSWPRLMASFSGCELRRLGIRATSPSVRRCSLNRRKAHG